MQHDNSLAEVGAATEEFRCTHDSFELTRRVLSDGRPQFVNQCLQCGAPVGTAVKRKIIELERSVDDVPPFDKHKWDRWKEERKTRIEQALRVHHPTNVDGKRNFWKEYAEYLQTPEWANRRAQVLIRANQTCEGCAQTRATQIHHLTYRHIGREFLFELVALCTDCHNQLHADHTGLSYVALRNL